MFVSCLSVSVSVSNAGLAVTIRYDKNAGGLKGELYLFLGKQFVNENK